MAKKTTCAVNRPNGSVRAGFPWSMVGAVAAALALLWAVFIYFKPEPDASVQPKRDVSVNPQSEVPAQPGTREQRAVSIGAGSIAVNADSSSNVSVGKRSTSADTLSTREAASSNELQVAEAYDGGVSINTSDNSSVKSPDKSNQ